MNNTLSKAELSQLAQFKLLMRQVHQYSVDLSLFVSDQTYAKEVLDLAEDTDQEGLMMLAIEIRAQFGLLQPANTSLANRSDHRSRADLGGKHTGADA